MRIVVWQYEHLGANKWMKLDMIYHCIIFNSNLSFKWHMLHIYFKLKEIDHNLENIGDIIVHFYPFTVGKKIRIRINQHINLQQRFFL